MYARLKSPRRPSAGPGRGPYPLRAAGSNPGSGRAACPAAANTVLFSVQYKRDSALASKTVAVSTVLSIITIPLLTILAQMACEFLY